MLGKKFDDALTLVRNLHRDQTRKSTTTPYLAHLMAVSGLVLEAHSYHNFENPEDIAIAALLHDAVEDQGHQITLEEIRMRFGDKVHDIVRDCSDAIIQEEGQQKAPWKQRKEEYIAEVQKKSIETQIVSCADKLHNARSILFDHDRIGAKVWERFNPSKEDTLWYYESLCDAFEKTWPENPLLSEFKAAVTRMRTAVQADTLIDFVTSDGRLYPLAANWSRFWKLAGLNKPYRLAPLILGGAIATDVEKQERLLAQIGEISSDPILLNRADQFLRNLPEEKWHRTQKPLSDEFSLSE